MPEHSFAYFDACTERRELQLKRHYCFYCFCFFSNTIHSTVFLQDDVAIFPRIVSEKTTSFANIISAIMQLREEEPDLATKSGFTRICAKKSDQFTCNNGTKYRWGVTRVERSVIVRAQLFPEGLEQQLAARDGDIKIQKADPLIVIIIFVASNFNT